MSSFKQDVLDRRSRTMTTNKEFACYVAVAVCNFDDVMLGVYSETPVGKWAAQARCRAVALKPKLRFDQGHQANDSELICARLFHAAGTKFTAIGEWKERPKRARAAKAK